VTAFHLKIIALATMIIDHVGAVLFPQYLVLRVIGRLAFPIYVYLLAEGFRHTKKPGRFLMRLGLFALVSQPAFDWAIRGGRFLWDTDFFNNTNIFYTLFLGGAAIYVFDFARGKLTDSMGKVAANVAAAVPLVAFMWLAEVLSTDYGAYGVVFIFAMYAINSRKFRLVVMALACLWQHRWIVERTIAALGEYAPPLPTTLHMMMIPATLAAVVLVAFYNGKRGPGFKWLFYWSYPVHLMVLAIVDYFGVNW